MSYIRILEVTADEPAPGMKTVDIAVLWSTRKAREHRVALTTIVSDSH